MLTFKAAFDVALHRVPRILLCFDPGEYHASVKEANKQLPGRKADFRLFSVGGIIKKELI